MNIIQLLLSGGSTQGGVIKRTHGVRRTELESSLPTVSIVVP